MATLRGHCACVAAVLLVAATPGAAQDVATWEAHIREASQRFGVPRSWIEQVMEAESGGRTTLEGRPIRSSAGAMGLMQLMPATWAGMRARLRLGSDPDDPRDNILAGTCYLRLLYDRFGYPGLFAAYNAGPQRYADYLAGRRPLPGETVAYLTRVAPQAGQGNGAPANRPGPESLFAIRKEVQQEDARTGAHGSNGSIFAVGPQGQ